MITKEQLVSLGVNQAMADKYYKPLVDSMVSGNINTPERIKYFIPQLLHESGNFRYNKELASGKDYEGRKDLGNTQKGDGVRYKGRGLIQITGRYNYGRLSKDLGVDFINKPELLETPEYATKSAVWYWNSRKISDIADKPDSFKQTIYRTNKDKTKSVVRADANKLDWVTYKINGGFNGLADRLAKFSKIKDFIFENKGTIASIGFFFWILLGVVVFIIYRKNK
jgi:putative chitinase